MFYSLICIFIWIILRFTHSPGNGSLPWSAVGLPQCSCCAKSFLFMASYEHIIWLFSNCQHVWCFWEVIEMLGYLWIFASLHFTSLQFVSFCSITRERTEIILQGTRNRTLNGPGVVWEEYEFKCKPGNVRRRPCLISPYHYRLDWLMWFAAFQVYNFGNNLYL